MKKMFVLLAVGVCCFTQTCLTQFATAQEKVRIATGDTVKIRFVIGVSGEAIDGEEGIVIRDVAEDSPAAAAGIKTGDIVLRIGETTVNTVPELSAAVQKAAENETTLRLLREGKKIAVEVTPMKRESFVLGANHGEGMVLGSNHGPGAVFGNDIELMTFVHPGVMLTGFGKLPKGVEVRVVGQGDKPSKIIVTKGDKKWETQVHKMHELPQDAKDAMGLPKIPEVGHLFRGQIEAFPHIVPVPPKAVRPRINGVQVIPMPAMPPQIYQVPQRVVEPRIQTDNHNKQQKDQTDERFDKIEKKIQAIYDAIEELQEGRPSK